MLLNVNSVDCFPSICVHTFGKMCATSMCIGNYQPFVTLYKITKFEMKNLLQYQRALFYNGKKIKIKVLMCCIKLNNKMDIDPFYNQTHFINQSFPIGSDLFGESVRIPLGRGCLISLWNFYTRHNVAK